jgi:signal transduction histidine kinase
MNCAILSEIFEDRIPVPEKDDEHGRFLASMAEGLHAMAQPLTILRSTIAALAAPAGGGANQQRYLQTSVEQVERACLIFDYLQDLVIAGQVKASRTALDLSLLIATVVDDQRETLQRLGIEIRVIKADSLPSAIGDEARTLQALASSLETAVSLSAPGDVIELLAEVRDEYVETTIRNEGSHRKPVNSLQRLGLLLAEANLLSQEGKWNFVPDPFSLCMALPRDNSESGETPIDHPAKIVRDWG